MPANYEQPLEPEHLQCCNTVIESTPRALDLAKKCKECGLPVDELADQLQAQLDMANKIKAKFYPMES